MDIAELSKKLTQTGKTFNAELLNDFGEFEVAEVPLNSTFIEITADGYYYNEISGALSQSRLMLKSLSDIRSREKINVNILTHVIIDRLKKHMDAGNSYEEAKHEAQKELHKTFLIDTTKIDDFEAMDLSRKDSESGVLLALSSIFQGNNSVAQLSKLLADFKEDFGDNGVLDNLEIQLELKNNAQRINTVLLRENLERSPLFSGIIEGTAARNVGSCFSR